MHVALELGNPRALDHEVRLEVVGGEVDGVGAARDGRERPALQVRGVGEQLVVGGELAGHCLPRRDRAGRSSPAAPTAPAAPAAPAPSRPLRRGAVAFDLRQAVLDDGQREAAGLAQRVRRRVHADAVGPSFGEDRGDARGAALAAVQVAVVDAGTVHHEVRVEFVGREVHGVLAPGNRGERPGLDVRRVDPQLVGGRDPAGDGLARRDRVIAAGRRGGDRQKRPAAADGPRGHRAAAEPAVPLGRGRRHAVRHAQRVGPLLVLARGHGDDAQRPVLGGGVDDARVAAAAAVVVLDDEVAVPALEPQERVEVIRHHVDGERPVRLDRQDPAREVDRIGELRPAVVQRPRDVLAHLDHPGDPAEADARGVGGRGPRALHHRQPEGAQLGAVGGVRVDAVIGGVGEPVGHARVALAVGIVVRGETVAVPVGEDQVRVEVVGGELRRDRVAAVPHEGVQLVVRAVGERRIRGQQATGGGAPHHEGDLGGERRWQGGEGGDGGEGENEQAARGGHSDSLSGCGIAGRAETKMQRWTGRHNHEVVDHSRPQGGRVADAAGVAIFTTRRNGPVARADMPQTTAGTMWDLMGGPESLAPPPPGLRPPSHRAPEPDPDDPPPHPSTPGTPCRRGSGRAPRRTAGPR